MTVSTIAASPDRTWSVDQTGVHVETHEVDFAVDAVRGDFMETVVVRGELDVATAPLLRGVLDTVYARRPWRVAVDMSEVTFVDGGALITLVAARRRLAAQRGVLVLREPSPIVRRVLELTGFDRVLETAEPVPSKASPHRAATAVRGSAPRRG